MRTSGVLWVLVALALAPAFNSASGQSEVVSAAVSKFGPPVLRFLAEWGASKLLDGVYDSVTGQPDMALLQRRLKELENNAALKSELQDAVRSFRLELDQRVTRDEMEAKLAMLSNKLVSLHTRIENLEVDRELHEVRLDDLERKTSNGTNSAYFVDRGNRFADQGDSVRALASFAAALRVDRRVAEAHLARALLYLKANAVEVADIDYSSAVEINGASPPARVGKATTCYVLNRCDEAIAEATAVLRIDPNLFDALFLRGQAFSRKGNTTAAIDDLQACLKIRPDATLVLNACGITYINASDYVAAESAFNRAIAADPIPLLYANRGNS